MFTIIDNKYKNVLYTGLSLEERKPKLTTSNRFVLTEDYATTPKVGSMKLDKDTHDFVYMTWDEVKRNRDDILSKTDWRDLPSYPGADQAAWRTYRQELRDLPQTYAEVENIVFPTEP
tara:strand:+ start:6906 stop:7259 length:354 start_codon:yes stop_codon:yes gene_type:complete